MPRAGRAPPGVPRPRTAKPTSHGSTPTTTLAPLLYHNPPAFPFAPQKFTLTGQEARNPVQTSRSHGSHSLGFLSYHRPDTGDNRALHHAARSNPHWKAAYERLTPPLQHQKTVVAIARKLLVAVWHVLTKECADRYTDPVQVACSFYAHAYKVGVRNLPNGQSALAHTLCVDINRLLGTSDFLRIKLLAFPASI